MKQSKTYIVIRNKNNGEFLVDYKSKRNTFAYEANFTSNIEDAATMDIKSYELQKDKIKKLVKAFGSKGCEVVKVEAYYNLTYPNGSDVKKIEKRKYDNPLMDLFKAFEVAKEMEEE